MENFTGAIEIATVPGIAAIVYGLIELYGRALTKAQKPPVAGTLAIAWALAAWLLLGVFPDPLTAIASGIFAGGLAIAGAALRTNYAKPKPDVEG